MARLVVGASNIGIQELNGQYGFAGFNSNTWSGLGGERWPRVTSNISIDSHFRSRIFYSFQKVREDVSTAPRGTVRVNSPFGSFDASSLDISNYVIDGNVYSTITFEAFPTYGYVFFRWGARETDTGARTIIGTTRIATFNLVDIYQYNFIEALFIAE